MTLVSKTTQNGPTVDATGRSVLGGTVTITTTDNGDGISALPKVYKNEFGESVIDTRDTNYGTAYGSSIAKVTQQVTKVNINTGTLHNEAMPEDGNVVKKMVMTIDTRPDPGAEKPVVLKDVGVAQVPTVQE